MTKQGILFDIEPIVLPPSDQLVIKVRSSKLSKEQQTFNRLSRQIEKLRKEIADEVKRIDISFDFYNTTLEPLERKLAEIDRKAVKPLYALYKKTKTLTFKEREKLEFLITDKLENVFCYEEPTEDLKAIYEEMEGVSYEEMENEQIKNMKDELEDMFSFAGYDIDLGDIDLNGGQEDIARKIQEIQEKIRQQNEKEEEKRASQKKTKKQIEHELKVKQEEEVKKKSISSIYKQLVKVFHPDLERDEERRIEKEELMKQLTSAYEARDLHTLLRLEMQWIRSETKNLESATEEKLAAYIRVLKEQVEELEFEKNNISENPKYHKLQKYSTFFGLPFLHQLKEMEIIVSKKIDKENASLELLDGKTPEKHLKKILKTVTVPFADFSFDRMNMPWR